MSIRICCVFFATYEYVFLLCKLHAALESTPLCKTDNDHHKVGFFAGVVSVSLINKPLSVVVRACSAPLRPMLGAAAFVRAAFLPLTSWLSLDVTAAANGLSNKSKVVQTLDEDEPRGEATVAVWSQYIVRASLYNTMEGRSVYRGSRAAAETGALL